MDTKRIIFFHLDISAPNKKEDLLIIYDVCVKIINSGKSTPYFRDKIG